jgi:hypothetical protein
MAAYLAMKVARVDIQMPAPCPLGIRKSLLKSGTELVST